MSIGNASILNFQQLLFYMLGPISQQKGRKMWKKMTRKAWKILKIAKTLIFRNWWFWNTLRVRCFIEKIFFEISWYFNIFDVSTLRNGHLWPKRSILGGQKWAKMPRPWKLAFFYPYFLYVFAYNSALRRHSFARPVGNESWDQNLFNEFI